MKEFLQHLETKLNSTVAQQQRERNQLRAEYLDRCGPVLGPTVFDYAVGVPASREAIARDRQHFAEVAMQALVGQSAEQGAAQLLAILEASEARAVTAYKRFETTTLPFGSKPLLDELPADTEETGTL